MGKHSRSDLHQILLFTPSHRQTGLRRDVSEFYETRTVQKISSFEHRSNFKTQLVYRPEPALSNCLVHKGTVTDLSLLCLDKLINPSVNRLVIAQGSL